MIWSTVARLEKDEKGEDILIYRSGLEFHEPRKEQVDFIAGIIESFLPGGALLRDLKVWLEVL